MGTRLHLGVRRCQRRLMFKCLPLMALVAAGACDRPLPNTPRQVVMPEPIIVTRPDKDKTMGGLSDIAQHFAAALQDARLRGALVRAMRDTVNNGTGIDLANCGSGTIVGSLLTAGELRGGGDAASLCERMKAGKGMILYMDQTRLAGWDSTTIPIVTAIADPQGSIAETIRGYRAPGDMIVLPVDGSVGGPVLVVLPYLHPRRLLSRHPILLQSVAIVQHASGSAETLPRGTP